MVKSFQFRDQLARGSIQFGMLVMLLASADLASAQAAASKPGVAQIPSPSSRGGLEATKPFQDALQQFGHVGGTIELSAPGTYYVGSPILLDQNNAIHIKCSAGVSRTAADSQVINIVYTGERGSLFSVRGAVGLEIDHCNLAYSNP